MIFDEAIEEMRERRRRLLKEKYDNSLERYFEEADKWQKQHPQRVVHPRPTETMKKAS